MASSIVSGNGVVFTTSTGASTVTATPTWSLGAGSNRGAVLLFSHKQGTSSGASSIASSVSVGGVAFTKIVNRTNGASVNHAHAEMWACNQASALSIGANPTISITYANGGTGMAQGVITTVQDCDQNLANWTFTATDGQLANTTMTAALTGFTSGSLVLGCYCDNTGLASVNCAVAPGDATTEFTSSDVTFNTSARAVQFYATADASPSYTVQRTTPSAGVYCALAIAGIPDAIADSTPPTLSSATIGTNGTTVTLAFSETVSIGAGGNGGFAITPSGGAATLTYSSGSGSSSLVYTASRTINAGETVTIAYTQPGNGVEDAAGNDLATFGSTSVTNNSTQSSGPTISNLSDSTPNYLGALTLTGTGFPTAQSGSAGVTIGGVAQVVTWNTSTSCSIASIARGTLKYGVSVDVVVTNAAGVASTGYATTLSPQAGWSYVDLSGTLATTGLRLEATPDLAAGHQVAYGNLQGTGTAAVLNDASITKTGAPTSIDAEVNDGTGWGATATQYFTALATAGRGIARRSISRSTIARVSVARNT